MVVCPLISRVATAAYREKGNIVQKSVFDDPSVALLEEIYDQELTAGAAGVNSISFTYLCCLTATPSNVLGNHGHVCTATVECQNNCNH